MPFKTILHLALSDLFRQTHWFQLDDISLTVKYITWALRAESDLNFSRLCCQLHFQEMNRMYPESASCFRKLFCCRCCCFRKDKWQEWFFWTKTLWICRLCRHILVFFFFFLNSILWFLISFLLFQDQGVHTRPPTSPTKDRPLSPGTGTICCGWKEISRLVKTVPLVLEILLYLWWRPLFVFALYAFLLPLMAWIEWSACPLLLATYWQWVLCFALLELCHWEERVWRVHRPTAWGSKTRWPDSD